MGSARKSLIREQFIKSLFFLTAFFAVIAIILILLFLVRDGFPILQQVTLPDFLLGLSWEPTAAVPLYGILPLIVGTILVTIGSMVFAVPLSIGCAIFIAELAPSRMKTILKPAIELLAGIPSVVYGFFGLVVLTNFIRVTFNLPSGNTWLAASVLLGIMALPTIVSVSEDAISSVPCELREGSCYRCNPVADDQPGDCAGRPLRDRCGNHSRDRQGNRRDPGSPDGGG